MDELLIITQLVEVLDRQRQYFDTQKGNAEGLLRTMSDLEAKHETPQILQIARAATTTYSAERTALMVQLEETLDAYFKEKLSEEYRVEFKTSRKMLFVLFLTGQEVLRFSLMEKGYALMGNIMHEDGYTARLDIVDRNISVVQETLFRAEELLESTRAYLDNHFLAIKAIRSFHDVKTVIFRAPRFRDNLRSAIAHRERQIEFAYTEIEREEETRAYYHVCQEKAKTILPELVAVFSSLGYQEGEKNRFYV